MELRVLTWNLFHGRSLPPSGRSLEDEFAALLASWRWDVALLQEVPPWWPARLAAAAGARSVPALTSRNGCLALRRRIAQRDPDLIKSNGGGANVVLCRSDAVEARRRRLRLWPERRVAQFVRLAGGAAVVNYHASTRVALAEQELARLWEWASRLADGAPLVLGGDLNLREPKGAPNGAQHVARRDVDHIFAVGLGARGEPEAPARRVGGVRLSDHPPLLAVLEELCRPGLEKPQMSLYIG